MTYQDLLDVGYDEYELERRIIQNGETVEQIAQEYIAEHSDESFDDEVVGLLSAL